MKPWDQLQTVTNQYGLSLGEGLGAQCERFHHLLVEANRLTNLTRIVEPDEAFIKHYVDSLLFLVVWPPLRPQSPQNVLDVGSGAGLPGIPLALARPDSNFTLLDSVGKKVNFLKSAIDALGLKNVEALQGRCEDLASRPPHREAYDVVTARAVAGMAELIELCLPFLRRSGVLIVSKGARGPEEMKEAQAALRALNGRLLETRQIELPHGAGDRFLYVIEKHGSTPREYPRRPGIPHREPIR
ncbi:MAG: 16S rRNA (guanine(527)-N(7))-methyltransferase RsmG [Candidatus Sericytochromatia bacterium]|nr:16S rRNA (guanine(527)-N(7))-methyltransferase RsmG [Candidatus Sericytochromatia bacterium]